MTTGSAFANIVNKRLMGFDDYKTRMLEYFRTLSQATTKTQFIESAAFVERIPISSGGNDTVQLDLKPTENDRKVHDGNGHILDITDGSGGFTSVFENTVAVVYEVGASYIVRPSGIQVNPRTGKPEYFQLQDDIGVEATPNLVTDNGSTMTFQVDSLFEADGTLGQHVGQTVRVFKVVPDANGLTEAVAIETATVFFGGGQNQITTAAQFGQATPSTTPADYVIQLVGLSVLRDTASNRPSQDVNAFFAGLVTGVGLGGPPTVFDFSVQNIIQADAASDTTFNPFVGAAPISWSLSSTDVQAVIEEMATDLSDQATATYGGASQVGVKGATYSAVAWAAAIPWGGLGADVTSVGQALVRADEQITKGRVARTASSDGNIPADYTGATALADALAASRTQPVHIKGTVVHDLGAVESSSLVDVVGEGRGLSRITHTSANGHTMAGALERMRISGHGTDGYITSGNAGMHVKNCDVDGTALALSVGSGATSSLRGGKTQPRFDGGAGHPSGMDFSASSNGGALLVENFVFDETTIGSFSSVDCSGHPEATVIFLNCLFNEKTNILNAGQAFVTGSASVSFIGCTFSRTHGSGGADKPLLRSTGSYIINCRFTADSGMILDYTGDGLVHGCDFPANFTAFAGSVTIINVESGTGGSDGARFTDNSIGLANSMDSASSLPLITFGTFNTRGVYVRGLVIGLHDNDIHGHTICTYRVPLGTGSGQQPAIEGLHDVTFKSGSISASPVGHTWGAAPSGEVQPALLEIIGEVNGIAHCSNISFKNIFPESGDTNGATCNLLYAQNAEIDGVYFENSVADDGETESMSSGMLLGDQVRVKNVSMTHGSGFNGMIRVTGSRCSVDGIFVRGQPMVLGPVGATVFIDLVSADHCRISGLRAVYDDSTRDLQIVFATGGLWIKVDDMQIVNRTAGTYTGNQWIFGDSAADYMEVSNCHIHGGGDNEGKGLILLDGTSTYAHHNTMSTELGTWTGGGITATLEENNRVLLSVPQPVV